MPKIKPVRQDNPKPCSYSEMADEIFESMTDEQKEEFEKLALKLIESIRHRRQSIGLNLNTGVGIKGALELFVCLIHKDLI